MSTPQISPRPFQEQTAKINPLNSDHHTDVLFETFCFLAPKENIQITTVCKTWNLFANNAFKMHIILKTKTDLNQKMEYMLSKTGKEVSDYCSDLKEPFTSWKNFSLKETYQHSINLTEKHTVLLNGYDVFYIEPNSYNNQTKTFTETTNQRINDIYGNGFLSFTLTDYVMEPIFCDGEPSACIATNKKFRNWQCEGICFFPIELFNVKIQGDNHEVIQINEAKDCCLSLRGKLIEFIVIDEPWSWTAYRTSHPVTARVPTLEQILHSYSPEKFYIPQLDAKSFG